MSEFHEPHLRGQSKLTDYTPIEDDDIATMKQVRAAGGSGDQGRAFFCTDIFSAGNAQVTWAPDTSPADAVVVSFISDTTTVQLAFLIEGGLRYSPTVNRILNEVEIPVTVTQSVADERLYDGIITLELTELLTDLQFVSSTGTVINLQATLATEGPEITLSTASLYSAVPDHTDAKEGDQLRVTGTVANEGVNVEIIGGYAAKTSPFTFNAAGDDTGGPGLKTFVLDMYASNVQGDHPIHVRAINALGTKGEVAISETVTLDQTEPVINKSATTYPAGQGALKGSEQATLNITVSDFDDVLYEFDNGTVDAPTLYLPTKTVTRSSGVDIVADNLTVTAHKDSNNSTTVHKSNVRIQTQAPSFGILFPNGDRYVTTPSVASGILTIQPSTDIRSLDSVISTEGLVEDELLLGPTLGRFKLSLDDGDAKGNHTITVTGTSLSGIQGSTESGFSIEGSVERTLTYDVASQIADTGTTVFNINNLVVKYAGSDDLLAYRPDKADYVDSFSIVDSAGNLDINGTHLWLSDVAFTGSNTSGTLQVTFAETP